jgi:hypothetical protein
MHCRIVLAVLLALLGPAVTAPQAAGPMNSSEAALRWIFVYRSKPQPRHVPAFVRALAGIGALRDPESSGTYVGFLAGVLNSNPDQADRIIARLFPLPADSHWAVVRAIAYSGLPEWKEILRKAAPRMPAREVMIEKYLAHRLPRLDQLALPKEDAKLLDKVKGYFSRTRLPKPSRLEPSPDVIDTLWGYYLATGEYRPVARVVAMLPWSKERDDVEKLTLGGMAKYTLATNAARDPKLLATLKWALKLQNPRTATVLREVIEAAEVADTAKIRREALAAIEELKRKGPGTRRDISWWGQIGQGAISLGCIGLAAAGVVAAGLPCVIGGAVSSGALYYWNAQQ